PWPIVSEFSLPRFISVLSLLQCTDEVYESNAERALNYETLKYKVCGSLIRVYQRALNLKTKMIIRIHHLISGIMIVFILFMRARLTTSEFKSWYSHLLASNPLVEVDIGMTWQFESCKSVVTVQRAFLGSLIVIPPMPTTSVNGIISSQRPVRKVSTFHTVITGLVVMVQMTGLIT
ncbi:hypothetical protein L9F63_011184, partial [Diploptera punctata]